MSVDKLVFITECSTALSIAFPLDLCSHLFLLGAELTDFVMVLNTTAAVRTFMHHGSITLGGNISGMEAEKPACFRWKKGS